MIPTHFSPKESLRAALEWALPEPYYSTLKIVRGRLHASRFERRLGLDRISRSMVSRCGSSVLAGPFAGMKYARRALHRHVTPKLLGSYECELHSVLAEIVSIRPQLVIDVGCAEGYYAIGLALRLPTARVHAFDIDPAARNLCREMARVNHVSDRVTVSGACDASQLQQLLAGGGVLISDCEGYEFELLRPDLSPSLSFCHLLVELHDFARPGTSGSVIARFSVTHQITLISTARRDASGYPALDFMDPEDRQLALGEYRAGEMQWAYMSPRIGAAC